MFLLCFFSLTTPQAREAQFTPPQIRKVIQNDHSHAGFRSRLLCRFALEMENDQKTKGFSISKFHVNSEGEIPMVF